MFNHCQTFAGLNAAYEQACENVKPIALTLEQMIAGADDGRAAQFDVITAAMHVRWSELSGEPWPSDDRAPVTADPRHFEDSDRPDMEQ